MQICIICKTTVLFNGENKHFTHCSSCRYENLSEEQKEILEKRQIKERGTE